MGCFTGDASLGRSAGASGSYRASGTARDSRSQRCAGRDRADGTFRTYRAARNPRSSGSRVPRSGRASIKSPASSISAPIAAPTVQDFQASASKVISASQ